ncbi:MAG: phosphohydrolase [Proteobacteria bacterium]|nr:phosphohydrolase [Pseudomonadota bacterium]
MQPEDLLLSDVRLFSMPTILSELNLVVFTGSTRDIVRLISTDAGLTARLLRIANSGYYGLSKRISSLEQAVAIVGTQQLITLVMATTAVNRFAGIRQDLVDMEDFWQGSVIMSVAADMLAEEARAKDRSAMFLAGLLHDLGSLILYSKQPGKSQDILIEAAGMRARVPELQLRAFGFTFADMGAALARHWKLPQAVAQFLKLQLVPLSSETHSRDSRIIRLAAHITTSLVDAQTAEETCERVEKEADGRSPLHLEVVARVMERVPERAMRLYSSLI